MSWAIQQITCQDLQGFNGRHVFPFQLGLNVIYGPSGQGKSSIVDCLRWALIGKYPEIDAIHAGSQSMINKNAGIAHGMPEVVVELVDTEADEQMIITRRGHKIPTRANENGRLTDGQQGMESLEVSVAGNIHTGWFGDAQTVIEEQLGLKSSTLAKCSVVSRDDITALISGKETEMNSVLHDLLDLQTLVNIGPILKEGKDKAEQHRTRFAEQLQGPNSPKAMWEVQNTQLQEDFDNLCEQARDEHGFEFDEMETDAQITEAITKRLTDCESKLGEDFSEQDELSERRTSVGSAVDELAGNDPNSARKVEIVRESEKLSRSVDDLKAARVSWSNIETEMSELLDDGGLDLVALATEKQKTEKLFNEKKKEKEALDLSEKLSTSVMDHLDAHSELDECPICKSPVEHAALKAAAVALMGPEIVALRSALNSEVDSLKSKSSDAKSKYESAERLHARILARVIDLNSAKDLLPGEVEMEVQLEEELLAGVEAVRACIVEIKRVKGICDVRQDGITTEEEELGAQSTTWRQQTLAPLREIESEVDSLFNLLSSYAAIDTHAGRYEQADEDETALGDRLEQARSLKGMLHSLESALTRAQQENASQGIADALPLINDIFSRVCGNPQYDTLQVDCTIRKGSIVYSFKTLPVQRTLGDVAAVVLSDGNQAVASVAALMALAAGSSHNFATLVMDDPCSAMDLETIPRWAEVASEFSQDQQLIVFTNQPETADRLEENGANRLDFSGWDDGILPGWRVN